MTANELAKQFSDKSLSGEYLSKKQGDWLFDLASKAGQADARGQRTARGTFDGHTWKLVRDQANWFFEVV